MLSCGPANRGFSLIELVMVITIIATLSAIAAPRYASSLTNYHLAYAHAGVVDDRLNEVVFDDYGPRDSDGAVVVTVGAISKTIVLDPDTGKAVIQ